MHLQDGFAQLWEGILKVGTPVCVPSKQDCDIGVVVSIENNHKSVDFVKAPARVAVKFQQKPSQAPRAFGRHFDHSDLLYSKVRKIS